MDEMNTNRDRTSVESAFRRTARNLGQAIVTLGIFAIAVQLSWEEYQSRQHYKALLTATAVEATINRIHLEATIRVLRKQRASSNVLRIGAAERLQEHSSIPSRLMVALQSYCSSMEIAEVRIAKIRSSPWKPDASQFEQQVNGLERCRFVVAQTEKILGEELKHYGIRNPIQSTSQSSDEPSFLFLEAD